MEAAAEEWITALSVTLPRQAALLRGLLTAVEADERWEWVELGCSVADGRGDELSDLDLGLGHVGPVPDLSPVLQSLGAVVDLSRQPWEGHERWWALYADGGQLDVLLMPADHRRGHAPRSVVLLDRSGRLTRTVVPRVLHAGPDEPRQWLLDGWEGLMGVVKHVRRGSTLEALEQVHRVRSRVYQLWAVGEGVDYPVFGLTSLLDQEGATVPAGIGATYSGDPVSAARLLAPLLARAGEHAQVGLDTPVRAVVSRQVEEL